MRNLTDLIEILKMKFTLIVFTLMCIILLVRGNENELSDDEIQEIINGYKSFHNNNNGMSEPVSNLMTSISEAVYLIKFLQIRELAQRTKDLTTKFFKTVGVEIAKQMCHHLDDIVNYIANANENKENDV